MNSSNNIPSLDAVHYSALQKALNQARKFQGATSPNPPVGAAALDENGVVLSVQAHEKAGTLHAEARVLQDCAERGLTSRIRSLVVTLEPCNHTGRTPPCTEAILNTPSIRKVIYGVPDPNPKVPGQGAQRLRQAGLEVVLANDPDCAELLAPFAHWITTGRPWVTVKTAWNSEGTMIPPSGRKTFTSESSLRLAHELRKRADAILTGSGTVLADDPSFTVRHVPDHPGKIRWLVVMDRSKRVPDAWLNSRKTTGFEPLRVTTDVEQALSFLGSKGALEVLVEAGPTLSSVILQSGLWNRHVIITQVPEQPDLIEIQLCSQASFKKSEK